MTDHLPYMPFYGDDFFGSTTTLTGAESFAYVAWLWQGFKRNGRLPNDDRKLRMWARCDRRHWSRLKAAVLGEFWRLSDDGTYWTNGRLDAEVAKVERLRARARMNGAKSLGRPPKQPELDLYGQAIDAGPYRPGHRGLATAGKKPKENKDRENRVGLGPEGIKKPRPKPRDNQTQTSELNISPAGLRPSPQEGGAEGLSPDKSVRAKSLPAGWIPKLQHYDLAQAKGFDSTFVDELSAIMRDHAAANTRLRKHDWDAEFSSRLRTALMNKTGRKPATAEESPISQYARALEAHNRGEEQAHDQDPGPAEPEILPPDHWLPDGPDGGDAGMAGNGGATPKQAGSPRFHVHRGGKGRANG
jgi:uncharacterized protein YdaU (DUF1376 family)